jgi:hypothetical protein
MKSEWPGLAFIENTTACDQIHSIRPPGVCGLNLIVEAIDQSGKFDPQPPHARASYRRTLLLIAWAAEQYIVLHIALHLPYVGGMSLKDVDGVEVDLALVLLGQFVEGGNLPSKGRSSKAAKDKNSRLIAPKGGQAHGRFCVQRLDGEFGCGIASLKGTFTCVHPHRLKGKEKVRRHRHSCHDMPEDFGRLTHGPIDISDEAEPKAEEHCNCAP